MRKDKDLAFELRRQGKSYKTIHRETGIPISTLAGWFKFEEWSTELRNKLSTEQSLTNPKKLRLIAEANKKRWRLLHESYRQAAIEEFAQLKDNPFFIAGIMLYWGEGDRKPENGVVRLANNDPKMINIFYKFLTQTLRVPENRIYAWVLLYPDLIDAVQKNFWSMATGIPMRHFHKSIMIKGKHPSKRLSYGVCNVVIHSRELKEKVLLWIELLHNSLQIS